MANEAKVGIFVLIGAALLGTAVFLLGDFSLKNYYTLYAQFDDVSGLPDKSAVKLSGVKVGKVKSISMDDRGKVVVTLNILEGVKIYKNSRFLVGSTSMIGSKFLQIDQGDPGHGTLKRKDYVVGVTEPPLERALADLIKDLQNTLGDLDGKSVRENLNQTLDNIRNLTAQLNQMASSVRPNAENAMKRLDSITANLDGLLDRTSRLAEKMDKGEGTMGALISDAEMKNDVASTIENLKDATASAKDVLGRITGFRTYLKFGAGYEPLFHETKADAGIKIYPREGRYYYLGASNMVNTDNIKKGITYEKINTVDALLGWEFGKFDVYGGAINGSGGVGVKYKPFSGFKKLALLAEVSEFSRRRYIKGRYFNTPKYDAGVEFDFNEHMKTMVRINDLAETQRLDYTANLVFEDKDIAYLFGLIGFASAGTKGRISSN